MGMVKRYRQVWLATLHSVQQASQLFQAGLPTSLHGSCKDDCGDKQASEFSDEPDPQQRKRDFTACISKR
jgi:hypothetical protein